MGHGPPPPQPGQQNAWPTGLCSCFSDCGTCCCGWWCLPCLHGKNAEQLGDSCFANCCLFLLCGHMFPCCFTGNRKKLRANHQLPEEPCSDCCTMCCCAPCAVCQEARVLKTHGPAPQFATSAQQPYYPPPPPQQMMH